MSSPIHQEDQYSHGSDDSVLQRKFLTSDEERELSTTTNRQERRRIQNRVAQRAYRQKQKRRLQELEQRLTSTHVGARRYSPLPEVDVEALRASGAFDDPHTWSDLAISYPIASMLNTRMGGRSSPTPPPAAAAGAARSNIFDEYRGSGGSGSGRGGGSGSGSTHAVGYIQSSAAEIPAQITPFLTISIIPVRAAVLTNLEILGIGLEQYARDKTLSPFVTGEFQGHPGIESVESVERVMENLMLRAPDLVPTSLQMRVQHYPYIDVIPSPALRNRILAALGNSTFVLDQEELCLDIEWGLRVWGRSAWDERSWEWSVEFVEKWLWLFEEETLASTNFWRKQRGEEIIGLTGEEADL